MKRGEIWWTDLGAHRPLEQTGRRPVVIWQSDALTSALQSVLVVPLTTNLDRAQLAGTAIIHATDSGPREDSVALAFQMRALPKVALAPGTRAKGRSQHKRLPDDRQPPAGSHASVR